MGGNRRMERELEVLKVDLENSRVYESRGGRGIVERPIVNLCRPNLVCSAKADIWRTALGSSEVDSSLTLRCMATSSSVSPNADATISALSLFDIRRTVDRLTNRGTSRRHRHMGGC
jgi:hypothetical protein